MEAEMGKTATKDAKHTDKTEDTEIEDEDSEVEGDAEDEPEDEQPEQEPTAKTKSDFYWKRKADKLEKENAALKAQKAKDDKELAAERKKLENRAEVEKYDSVIERLEDAGLPAKMRHLIDLSWSDERIDKAIDLMKDQLESATEKAKSTAKTKDRRQQDEDELDDEEDEPAPKQRRTRQAGEDRPQGRSNGKLRDLSGITDPTKRLEEAAKDI